MPTQLSFPVTREYRLLPVHSVTSRAVLVPPPQPGPAQVTRVSRLCPGFLTPRFVASWKKQCCLIFPGRRFISIPTTPKGTELTFSSSLQTFVFPLFVFQCSSFKYRSTETRRRYQESTSVLEIALEQLFFSPFAPLHIPQFPPFAPVLPTEAQL